MGKVVSDRAKDSRISVGMGPSVQARVGKRAMAMTAVRRLRVEEGNDRLPGKAKILSAVDVRNSSKTGNLYPVYTPCLRWPDGITGIC